LENHVVERASVLAFNLFASIARARKKLAVQRACVRARFCIANENAYTHKNTLLIFEFSKAASKKKKYANPKYFKKA